MKKPQQHPYRRPALPTANCQLSTVSLTQRHRNCLAAVVGGGAAVGANIGDVIDSVARLDRNITEREVQALLADLAAARLIEISVRARDRYVPTPKGIEVLEA